jgi:hypothetical protein
MPSLSRCGCCFYVPPSHRRFAKGFAAAVVGALPTQSIATLITTQLLPSVPHGWLIQEVSQELVAQAAACGFEMLCPRANALTAEGVQLIRSRGLVVRAWGVKTLEVRCVACF